MRCNPVKARVDLISRFRGQQEAVQGIFIGEAVVAIVPYLPLVAEITFGSEHHGNKSSPTARQQCLTFIRYECHVWHILVLEHFVHELIPILKVRKAIIIRDVIA